jgi:hypothetical protein
MVNDEFLEQHTMLNDEFMEQHTTSVTRVLLNNAVGHLGPSELGIH